MRHVTFVIPQGCQVNLYSVGGAFEILKRANRHWEESGNATQIVIAVAGFIGETKSPEDFLVGQLTNIRQIKKTDLIIIPPVYEDYDNAVLNNSDLVNWIRDQYKSGAELASMCSGAFILASTGLLEGKMCSTHWNSAEKFRVMFPDVHVAEGKIITEENGIYTNGGGYSFLNLMLYLVEKIFDRSTAIYCSKIFQIEIDRITQSPFIIFNRQKSHGDEVVERAQSYIEEHVAEKISFEYLASHLAISRRNFDRRFSKATGNSPMEYLQRVKIEVAKKELEKGRKTIAEIMDTVGYNDEKAFREVFRKITGLSPVDYKSKYGVQHV